MSLTLVRFESVRTLKEICVCNAKADSGNEFVGIRCEKDKDGKINTRIFFPLGYFTDEEALHQIDENELRECIINLFSVLSDETLIKDHYDSSISTLENEPDLSNFPMVSYLNVIRNYFDYGYITEKEIFYKKGAHGKVSWGRTIKTVRPIITEDEENLVYLEPIARKVNYNENCLISLVHKYCVHDALSRLGFLFGIEPTDEPVLDFDYDLFCNAINSKLAKTFNDRELHLLSDLARIVEYLAEHSINDGDDSKEFYYGVNKFAPVWEGLVNQIFGTISADEKRANYNPSLKFVAECAPTPNPDGVAYQEEVDRDAEYKRSTLRPDTIMICDEDTFVLDSKYYRYGMTGAKSHLPGAESVCKQMAYAEYVKKNNHADNVYNAFVMPYCADAGKWNETNAEFGVNGLFGMSRIGYIYGDWKNREQGYHKIHCILLDMKSVMRNYASNPKAQENLAILIKD